jgi:hypothetical protein
MSPKLAAFASFLKNISSPLVATESCWYLVADATIKKKGPEQFDLSWISLQKATRLSKEKYYSMLEDCGLVQLKKNDAGECISVETKLKQWEDMILNHDLSAEVAKKRINNGQLYFIRLGPKQKGYFGNVKLQLEHNIKPINIDGLGAMQRSLRAGLGHNADIISDEDGMVGDADESDNENDDEDGTGCDNADNAITNKANANLYPQLQKLGITLNDLLAFTPNPCTLAGR